MNEKKVVKSFVKHDEDEFVKCLRLSMDHSSLHLRHERLLTVNLTPSLLSFHPSFNYAARSEAQKGAACFSNLGSVVML